MIRLFSVSALAPAEGVLRELLLLRGYGLLAQLAVLAVATWVLRIELPLHALLVVVAMTSMLAVLTGLRLRQDWPVTALECLLQLLADVALLTALLYFSGGAGNPFVSLYLLPIMIAATTLPVRLAWLLTGACLLAYSLLMRVYEPLTLPPGASAFSLHLMGMWLNFILSALLITYFIGRMAQSLRKRDQALAQIRERRMRDEQIVALGNLAAGTAHELSTPLATMSVLVGELAETCADRPDQVAAVEILRQQIRASKDILTRLARRDSAGRAESGGVIRLDVWLHGLLETWRVVRPQAQVSVHWLRDAPVPELIRGDTLDQAVINLCNNAADAGAGQVQIELDWDRQAIELAILDRGSGFRSELPAGTAIFSTKREHGGIGIGLMLANASVEQYGGSVSLLDRPGGGARVVVRLPRHGGALHE